MFQFHARTGATSKIAVTAQQTNFTATVGQNATRKRNFHWHRRCRFHIINGTKAAAAAIDQPAAAISVEAAVDQQHQRRWQHRHEGTFPVDR